VGSQPARRVGDAWLALACADRDSYAHKDDGYRPATWIADALSKLVLAALRTGEITLVEGPEVVTDTLEVRDRGTLRAMRVEFRVDQAPAPQSADPSKKSAEAVLADGDTRRHTGSETPVADLITQARLALIRDIIKPNMKPGERRRTAVQRLLRAGVITELPGVGVEDTRLREITRGQVWDRVVEVKQGVWQIV